jgi:2-polyprenyl-6-methoxyphenol hydroxylase-like FAD-dependent oxidoreductase
LFIFVFIIIRSGYSQYIVARPLLYDLLLRQVPSDKIQFNKRILTIKEEDDMVTIQAADNSVFEGDILVGADGAYSAVRQRLYERLKREGKLPKSDQEELPFSCTCLVGQTEPMDYESTFPEFMVPTPPFYNTLGEKEPFTVSRITKLYL